MNSKFSSNSNDKEDKLILSRAEDTIKIAERSYSTKYIGFLNPYQRSLILKNIYPSSDITATFEGGYPDAERTMYVCRPEYAEAELDNIIKVISVSGRDLSALTHRDYLGSLMGLGITRENIGDILVSDTGAVIFVKSDIADYIVNNLDKIGRHGVSVKACEFNEIDVSKPKTKEIRGTVSSLRLDAVLSLGGGISRGKAAEMIEREQISVNWAVVNSASRKMEEGDLISASGIGRMRVGTIGGLTRKGRIGITVLKYE